MKSDSIAFGYHWFLFPGSVPFTVLGKVGFSNDFLYGSLLLVNSLWFNKTVELWLYYGALIKVKTMCLGISLNSILWYMDCDNLTWLGKIYFGLFDLTGSKEVRMEWNGSEMWSWYDFTHLSQCDFGEQKVENLVMGIGWKSWVWEGIERSNRVSSGERSKDYMSSMLTWILQLGWSDSFKPVKRYHVVTSNIWKMACPHKRGRHDSWVRDPYCGCHIQVDSFYELMVENWCQKEYVCRGSTVNPNLDGWLHWILLDNDGHLSYQFIFR